jgi:hypothetical protein
VHTTSEIGVKFLLALLLFAAPAALMARTLPATHLAYHQVKIMFVNLVSVLVAFIPVQGIWYVGAALGSRPWREKTAADAEPYEREEIKDYLLLGESLHRFITFLGAMIGLATLAKGASRHAFVATGGRPADFPPEFVLLHGAFFTALLALVYIPTYNRLVAAGVAILDAVFPVNSPDLDLKKLAEWQSNRKSLEELLQLRANALDNLRVSLSILAPLASSAISILLGDQILLKTK